MCVEQLTPINGVSLWNAIQGKAQPMVLCHGGPGGYDYLGPVADMIGDVCRVLRYDQRGSGRSGASAPYDVATFVADLDGLREHFGFESWIVAGHSWGANLALAYAVEYPTRTRAVLYISGTGIDPRWHEEYRGNRLASLSDPDREEFQRLRAMRDEARHSEEERVRERLTELTRKTDVFDPGYVDFTPGFDRYPVSHQVNQIVNADWNTYEENAEFHRAVHELSMPVLFLHGAADPRPAHFLEELSSHLVRGHFIAVERCGHYPWIEQREEFMEVLRSFVLEC